ncbi:MAG: FAD-dependent oxidoreductase [Deltaproteobacteria bacterium]|nr:FAD-dependent oxidoreductase [Deltaproteobacteria bacterium]MBW2283605.1 FAD-dependent oxidoreductase [Deltaproteobacteria bacterium]
MKLFEPGHIGGLQLKNRIIMAPMGIGALAEPDGRLSRRAIDYYTARAKGGAGMIITGLTCVDVEIEKKVEKGFGTFARADHPIHINPLSELADAVHDYGAKLCVQLTAGMGRVAYGTLPREGHAVAPSETPCFWAPKFNARELTTREVEGLVRAFSVAALYLKVAGVDAVQLHGHEGYLMDQFQSALWNRRTDKYGGDLEGRLAFPLEAIRAIKARAGEDFPVIYRYGLVHHVEGGRELPESLEMARQFEAAGVDALEADAGCYETWYWAHPPTYQPPGCMVDMAEAVKEAVNIPVISVGKLGYPDLAESVLREGKADFVCLGRALLADPDWPNKIREGRREEVRPCIGDHTGCLGRVFQGKSLSCTVNPAAGNERAFALRPTESPRSVLVVGGGPGGMQAAMAAAERGHRVQLWERSDRLGGTLIPASVPEFKRDLRDLAAYLSREVYRSGVGVLLEREADAGQIESAGADAVIVATGARPVMPEVAGADTNRITTALDLLRGQSVAGDDVLIIGGGLVGCETALYLAQSGRRVTVVEMLDLICKGEHKANRQHLVKLLSDTGVEVLTGSKVSEITADGGVVATGDEREMIKADTIIMAAGMRPENTLYESLTERLPEVHRVGDCVKPRRVMEAIWEGYRVARLI